MAAVDDCEIVTAAAAAAAADLTQMIVIKPINMAVVADSESRVMTAAAAADTRASSSSYNSTTRPSTKRLAQLVLCNTIHHPRTTSSQNAVASFAPPPELSTCMAMLYGWPCSQALSRAGVVRIPSLHQVAARSSRSASAVSDPLVSTPRSRQRAWRAPRQRPVSRTGPRTPLPPRLG